MNDSTARPGSLDRVVPGVIGGTTLRELQELNDRLSGARAWNLDSDLAWIKLIGALLVIAREPNGQASRIALDALRDAAEASQ